METENTGIDAHPPIALRSDQGPSWRRPMAGAFGDAADHRGGFGGGELRCPRPLRTRSEAWPRVGRLLAEGMVEYAAPQTAGREAPFRSEICEHPKGVRTQAPHLMAGSKEDAETVTAFFEDMPLPQTRRSAARGLRRRPWHHHQGEQASLPRSGASRASKRC